MKVNAQRYSKLVLKVMKHDLFVTKNVYVGVVSGMLMVQKWQFWVKNRPFFLKERPVNFI